MLGRKSAARGAFLLFLAACTGDAGSPLAPEQGKPALTISDAAHAGAVPGFYFLPPMLPQPSVTGTFDAALSPRAEICELVGTSCGTVIGQFSMTSGTGSEVIRVDPTAQQYQFNWHTGSFDLSTSKNYRISIFVGSTRLGFADVDVVGSGKDLKNVDTNQFIPLLDDRTLPVKFRIETGIAGAVVVTPPSATVAAGGTQQFTATVTDLHGNPLAASVTWRSSDTTVAKVSGTGLATGVAPGSATITATSGAASGTATLTVINPNTPPVAKSDTFDAIGNVTVPVAAPGVLANDTDAEGNTLSVTAGSFPTAGGGTVTLAADGSFHYLSAAGFTGTDSFDYVVSDGQAADTATVQVQVGSRVWYVRNDATAPGDGRDASPFTTLKAAESASAAGETLFLLAGNGTTAGYDEGIVLKVGQSLTGQGVSSDVTAVLNGQNVVLLAAGSAPQVTRSTAGATIRLATGNTVQGVNVASTAGAGIAGTAFGTFTAGSVRVSAVGGPALDLENGSVAAVFPSLSSTGSVGTGLRLHDLAGTLTGAGGSIAGAAVAGVEIDGGTADVAYAGDVTATAGRVASVTGRSGGTVTLSGDLSGTGAGLLVQGNSGGTVAFTGSSKVLNTGSSPAVSLLDNTGATVRFAGGGLTLTTGTATSFDVSGGGTVIVTGANNAIGAVGGTALRVVNTDIGVGGLTFRAISASGGANGIVLSNTGSTAGLQVTGTGSAGSGGTIQNTSVSGINLTNAQNISLSWMNLTNANSTDAGGSGVCDGSTNTACNGAVKLNGVTHVALDHLAINGSAEEGINGTNVTHLTLSNSTISGAGNEVNESGIYLFGLFGTTAAGTANSITNTTVTGSGSANHNVFIRNSTATNAAPGAPDRLLISNSSFVNPGSAATHSAGIRVLLRASANFQTVVQNSSFTQATLSNGTDGIQVDAGDASTSDVSITSSTFTGWNQAPINLSSAGTATQTFNVFSNPTISGGVGNGINVIANNSSTARGFITSNSNITSSSASNNGIGISLEADLSGRVIADVNGNTVTSYAYGSRAVTRDAGTAQMDLTLRNNTITAGGSFPFAGFFSENANGDGQGHRICLNLSNNQISKGSNPSAFIDYSLGQYTGSTYQLQGYAGAAGDATAVQNFISDRDIGGAEVDVTAGTTVNFTSGTCTTP